jgi:aminoglycoside phosphotransferase (APT) family kinase protein
VIEPPLAALGLDPATRTEAAGGTTGRLWRVCTTDGTYALRLTPQKGEFAAMAAAHAAGLPVPAVVRQAEIPYGTAALLDWSPGVPLAQALLEHPDNARRLGESVGAMQRRLNEVPAPPQLGPPDNWMLPPGHDVPDGKSLLHLDFHWLNVLTDGTGVTAILDWENARRGPAVLDQARTWSLLNIEPSLAELDASARTITQAFAAGWMAGYGIDSIPGWAKKWAAAAMFADLTPRYADRPHLLDPLRSRT